jgi:hypothetical protein
MRTGAMESDRRGARPPSATPTGSDDVRDIRAQVRVATALLVADLRTLDRERLDRGGATGGLTRRDVAVAAVTRLADVVEPRSVDVALSADRALADSDGPGLAERVALAHGSLERRLDEPARRPGAGMATSDLAGLLAWIELLHIRLDVGYDLAHLPASSRAACALLLDS